MNLIHSTGRTLGQPGLRWQPGCSFRTDSQGQQDQQDRVVTGGSSAGMLTDEKVPCLCGNAFSSSVLRF